MVLHLQPFWILMHVFGSLHWPVCLTRSFAVSLWARGSSSFGPIFTSMDESLFCIKLYVLFLMGMVWNYSCRFLPHRLLNCSTHRATCKGVEHLPLNLCLQLVWYMYACSMAFLELSCTVFFCDKCYVVSLSECKFCRGLHTWLTLTCVLSTPVRAMKKKCWKSCCMIY